MVSFWWSGPSNPILQWPWVPGRRKCNERAPQIYHKWFGLPTSDPDITPRILSQVPPELVTWLVISQSGTNISSFGRFLLLTECFLYMSSPSMFSPHFKEILVPDWLITSHVTYITSSDWFLKLTKCFFDMSSSTMFSSHFKGSEIRNILSIVEEVSDRCRSLVDL